MSKSTKTSKKNQQTLVKVPAFLESLLWGDFVLGLSFIIFSAIITFEFFKDLVSPQEIRQWALLFAPVIIIDIAIIVALSLYLMKAPYKVTHSKDIHQLRQRLYTLLVVNGLAVLWMLYNKPYHYAFIAEIVTAILIVLNILAIFWTRSLVKK